LYGVGASLVEWFPRSDVVSDLRFGHSRKLYRRVGGSNLFGLKYRARWGIEQANSREDTVLFAGKHPQHPEGIIS
jgi:hypothetical protein